MRSSRRFMLISLCGTTLALCALAWGVGCGTGGEGFSFLGALPFGQFVGSGDPTGPGNTGNNGGNGGTGGNDRTDVDPCTETQSRKFVRISMRNDSDTFVHYFVAFIAFVNGDAYPAGAVCPDDVGLYTSFGYTQIPEGSAQVFGNYCIEGPALLYFHRAGQFRGAGANGQLGSAIAPAQGSSGSFDAFFSSSGASVPVPNLILFHNPGTGQGQALKVSRNTSDPCAELSTGGDTPCSQDAFYYVDTNDLLDGSTALGVDSGRRVPNEIQGTGCECLGQEVPVQQLGPSRVTANSAVCNEFLRGGTIEYVFVRDDQMPPYPQLLWRVTDATGSVVHDFDERANLP